MGETNRRSLEEIFGTTPNTNIIQTENVTGAVLAPEQSTTNRRSLEEIFGTTLTADIDDSQQVREQLSQQLQKLKSGEVTYDTMAESWVRKNDLGTVDFKKRRVTTPVAGNRILTEPLPMVDLTPEEHKEYLAKYGNDPIPEGRYGYEEEPAHTRAYKDDITPAFNPKLTKVYRERSDMPMSKSQMANKRLGQELQRAAEHRTLGAENPALWSTKSYEAALVDFLPGGDEPRPIEEYEAMRQEALTKLNDKQASIELVEAAKAEMENAVAQYRATNSNVDKQHWRTIYLYNKDKYEKGLDRLNYNKRKAIELKYRTPERVETLGYEATKNIVRKIADYELKNNPENSLYVKALDELMSQGRADINAATAVANYSRENLNIATDGEMINELRKGAYELLSPETLLNQTLRAIPEEQINEAIMYKVEGSKVFKELQTTFTKQLEELVSGSNESESLSDAEVKQILGSLSPEERKAAEEEISRVTQEIEGIQREYSNKLNGLYKQASDEVSQNLYNSIVDGIVEIAKPEGDAEYIFRTAAKNSIIGLIGSLLNDSSDLDKLVAQRALESYNPSTLSKIGAGVLTLLYDSPIFAATGGLGEGAATGARVVATNIVASNIARQQVSKAVSKAAIKEVAKRKVAHSTINRFGSAALAQAITLGGYNGVQATLQEAIAPSGEGGKINWDSVLHRVSEGALTGVTIGTIGAGTRLGKNAMYRSRPDMAYTFAGKAADFGIDATSFAAENAAFLGVGSLMSGEPITIESIVESVGTLGTLKGIGVLKRVAKREKLRQQPNWLQSTLSDLNFTKEELNAMRQAGVNMSQIELVEGALLGANEAPTVEAHNLTSTYNFVMESRAIPTSAKMKLRYLVTGTLPRVYGPSSYKIVDGPDGVSEVRTYDYLGRLVQIDGFGSVEAARNYAARLEPVLEANTINDAATAISGADTIMALSQAVDAYMESSAYAETGGKATKAELMSEMLIASGMKEGSLAEGATARVETISGIANNYKKEINTVNDIKLKVLKAQGATMQELDHAINIKPDRRTVKEANLVKAYVEELKAVKEATTGPTTAEQATSTATVQRQIEQGAQEIADAQQETEFVRQSLNEAAKRIATADGKNIAIVRLENGEQVAVHTGLVLRENGTIDYNASEETVVVKRIDAEGNEHREFVGIDDIAEVIEQGTPEDTVEASMGVLQAQATKKLSLDKALSENGEQGVAVTTIDGSNGVVVGVNEDGAYIFRFKGSTGKELDLPVSIDDIAEVFTESPIPVTTEQAAIQDAEQNVAAAVQTAEMEAKAAEEAVTYDYDYPPITEADLAPVIDFDKIEWEKLTPEEYANISVMSMGDATTLSSSHTYYVNSRAKLQKAKARVAEQQKVIDKLNSRFATLSSPAEAQKLRKQVATAEQEKAKREQAVKNIEEQMAKYAHAMRKYGVEVATENDLLSERTRLEEERNALLEADKELDRYEQEEATNGKKTIANTAANRKYIEQLYADRFGVSPAQAGPRQAILWDLANGAIKLRWDNVTTDSGAVQKGLAAELGLSAAEKRIYKAVTDNKNGQSVDAYAHDLWQGAEWGQEVDDMTLKDMILDVLQSTPNGSIALKELADMSGVQADLEAQISLGKGDIQRKLEEVDANLAKNAQQMADFRKRINDTVQKLESGEPLILPVGEGEFGPIYDQFKGKPHEAVDFLLAEKNGEAIGALSHKDIGEIDLVWGEEGTGHSDGYGLSKLAKYHPEVLDKLQSILDDMEVVSRNANRVNLESPKYQAAVRLTWNNERKNWLLTAFEKRNSAIDNTTDTGETAISGKQNDTATLQSTASENKDTTSIPENQISEEEFFGNAPISEDIPFMIEQKPTEQAVSETEQNFEREVFDAFAGHLGETLGAESVVTDAAEANRVLEWHQAVGERLRTAVSENAEIASERAEIERVAKENGTWLKAPNGKDTNLTERQWVDVRTSRFKSWFGDMGKAFRVAKLRDSKSVTIPNNINEGKYELTQESAENYILQNMRKGYRINDTGETVFIHRKGAQKVTSHSVDNEAHLKSIAAIPEMLEKAIFIEEVPADPNKSKAKYDFYRYYICGLRIGVEDYTVRLTIGVKQGKHYYDHSLTEIEKGNLIEIANGFIPQRGRTIPANAIGKDTKLIPLLQINSSKVVDANGEPMVVYHGTPNQFNTFNRELIGSSTDRGIWGRGFYFTSNKAEAERYTKRGDVTGEVKEVFLNIRKPLAIKAEQGDAGKEYIQSLYRKHVTDEIFEDPRTTDAKLAEATQKVTDELVENGYDGVVVTYKDGTQEYVVFNPNQIKSATENIGTFDSANNDIRMSIAAYHGSGADFEKFDHKFMGTGEGAQSFGWGTYVTEVENIAKGYARTSGESARKARENEIQLNLLYHRKQIADERRSIENSEKTLAELKEAYARVETELQQAIFAKTKTRKRQHLVELEQDIEATQALIDVSLAAIERLTPKEELLSKEWEKTNTYKKVEELKQLIEWDKSLISTSSAKVEKFEKALVDLEQSGEIGEQFAKDLIELVKLEAELRGEEVASDKEIIVANIEDLKYKIELAEKSIANKQKEIEELQAIEQPKYRNLYSVEVPDNTGENYLPWDKDLTPEMKDRIYPHIIKNLEDRLESLRNSADAENLKGHIAGWENVLQSYQKGYDRKGVELYSELVRQLHSDKAASEFLHSIGFTGIEYPAQYTTGGRADGAKNYVIFNADDVKIVDHVQYFKTPNGEVYGFVYEDKIYLDPTNIDPKAPVHEYTELWCREVAKANKPLWERGKELVKQTKVWEEVNADENYKNQSEDLRASEAWSRIIADEMTGKAREYGSKGLMAKLRGWLRSFWKTVKSVVEKWTKKDLEDLTVEQFKKMTMADFINKVDPRKWNAKKPKEVSKSLVGIHNISLDKLQKALKQGGLANPSAAVIDIAKGDHFDYGEYSFIMPKSLVDKKSGRNIGTFDRDAWTPLYPSVEYSHSKESRKNLNKLVEGLDEGLADKIKRETLAKVNGNGFYSGLQIVFLKERGVEVPIASKAGKFFGTIDEFKQLFGGKEPTYENYQALDKAQKDEVTLWIRAKGMPEEIARYKELLVKPARKEGLWNFLLDDVGYGKFDQAVSGLQADARNVGTPDYEKTIDNAVNYIRENGLQEEFDAWQSETINNLGFDERIQVGISPSGDRIMRKNTLENVSKYMRRQGKNASADHWSNSEGKMLAQLVQNFSSLDKIRANKGRLRSAADDVVGIRKRINEMAQVFMNFAKHTDLFMEEQSALAYLEDILVGGMDPDKVVAEFNAATKRNVTLTEEQKAEMKQLREDMKSLPVQYFETKFERPVMFNEFAAVVAPDTMPESVEQQLRDAGLAIYKYNPDVEGDRRKTTLAATASEDIRFMIVGEKGAAALDQAEEATTRLDNLAVAREMEAEYKKAIKRSRSKGSSQDLTTSIVHLPSNGTKIQINIESAKKLLSKVIDAYQSSRKSRGFLSDINRALGNNKRGDQSHYFELALKDSVIEIRTSNHNANANNFDGKTAAVSIVIKPKRDSNTFKANDDVELTEYVYFKEDIAKGDGTMLSSIADSISEMLTTGQYVDKTGKAKVNISGAKNIAKRIKLATGWERGADGKWRYETQDFITREAFTKVVNNPAAHDAYVKSEMDRVNKQLQWLGEILDGRTADWVDKRIGGSSEPTFAERYPDKAQEIKGYFAQFANKEKAQAEFDRLMEYAKVVGRLGKNEYMLDEFVEDKTLFSAYPSLRNVKVVIEKNRKQDYGGNWNEAKQTITIVNYKDRGAYEHESLLHEVQHAIQDIEGFSPGGNAKLKKRDTEDAKHLREIVRGAISFVEFYKNEDIAAAIRDSKKYGSPQWSSMSKESQDVLLEYLGNKRKVKYEDIRKYLSNAFDMTLPREYGKEGYRRFAGEVEARAVSARRNMSVEERRATLLAETEDVAREDQIFLESNLGVAQSVEVSEPVEVPTRKPRKSAAEKSLEKIESLREQLKNKKRSLNDTLLDVYNFLTSKDIAETMGEGVGKAQYRRVIKNSIEAIRKAYDVTDAEEKRKTIFKYLGEIDDNLSQLLTRQRLNEVTDILDKAIYGYTAQGVRTGKRIDEHTREIFDILRNAIGEPVEEERDDSGRRKPVHYRLKNRTEAGDITSSFRLRSVGSNEGIIAKLRSEADDIIASADVLDTASVSKAAQLEYTANLLSLYDNALQLNEAIGQTTDAIADIQREIERTNEQYKAAATGSEEKKNLYKMRQKLQNDLEAEQMNRAALRHRYASILKTFTISLEELDEKGAGDFARAELEKAEQAVKWRRGVYNSIKNPNAPVLPVEDYDRQGKEVKVNWKGLNTRAKINESLFMATFAEMSRDIDINSIPGQWAKDGWYYQFMLAPGGYMERTDWRYKTEKALHEEVNAAVSRIFGKSELKDKLAALSSDAYNVVSTAAQKESGIVIPRLSVGKDKNGKTVGGYQDNIPLTIDEIVYMRNTIRQPNGYAGYLAWGIPEEDMRKIAQYAEANYPEYCRFADWVVTEFLPKLYDMQDAIYFKKFGTHLPKTAFYFPFVRDKRMVGKIAEVGEGEVSLPSSVTGNIVERVKTSAKMDLSAGMFKVLQNHLKETLDWCAYVELTDKFNSLSTSHYFGNLLKVQGVSAPKLKEMFEIAVGQGKINSTDNTAAMKLLNAAAKGVVAGNITLNLNAAAKQIVSATATLSYSANPKLRLLWAKNFFVPSVINTGVGSITQKLKTGEINPVEVIDWKVLFGNWKWAIENIPTLRERWEGREAGFEVMKSHSFETWDKLSSKLINVGMSPNAFVDMMTCSNAAKTVYEYEYPRLLKRGRSKTEAHREACVKAAIFVNETQQSSLNGFLSSFQSGGGVNRVLGLGLGAYQNSSMAFARNERFAITNMLRMLNPTTRQQMIARQAEAYKELGVEESKATELAKSDFNESYGQQFSGFLHNGVLNNYIWAIASVVITPLLAAAVSALFDKEEWEKLWNNEEFRQELSNAVSLETVKWQSPMLYNAPGWKQAITFAHNKSDGKKYSRLATDPVIQNVEEMLGGVSEQWIGVKDPITGERTKTEPTRYDRSAGWLVFSTLVKAGLGVNPDVLARMSEGVSDAVKDGVHVEDIMNVLNSPRGLTRAIAGEPRDGESRQEYLDRLSYIYRQVNAGSGNYDKKFVAEHTKKYIEKMDNKIYKELGIEPREMRILEQRVKAIRNNLTINDKSRDGIRRFQSKSDEERVREGRTEALNSAINKLSNTLSKEDLDGNFILPFDEVGIDKRKELLKRRYELLKEVVNMWNNK